MNDKKITLATLKAFIRKNAGELYIRNVSDFNGMTDGVEYATHPQARRVTVDSECYQQAHTLGIRGVWVVGGSRDHITAHEKDGESGLHVYNCCGSFDLFTITKACTCCGGPLVDGMCDAPISVAD